MSLRLFACLLFYIFILTATCRNCSAFSFGLCQDDGLKLPSAASSTTADSKVQEASKPVQDSKSEPKQDSKPDLKPESPKPAAKQDPKQKAKPETAPQPAGEKKVSELKSSELLPPSTRAWVSIPDINRFESQFDNTQIGKLLEDEQVKPFFEAAKSQLQDFLDEKNLRVGLKIDDILSVRTGEVCIAGVLQDLEGGQPARGSHGLVLLVDVTSNEEQTKGILTQLNADLKQKNGGTIELIKINETDVTKLSSQNPKRIRQTRNIFQAIKNGWLLVADNEEIFRDILRRLHEPEKIDKAATLGSYAPYIRVMKETELFGGQSELSWFVDPFGYMELARKLYEEEQAIKEHHEDWASKLQLGGFDSVKGIGGNLGILLDVKEQKLESFSRIFILAPRANSGDREKNFFNMFDFSVAKPGATDPNAMISDNAAAFFGGNWQFTKLLWAIEPLADSIMGEKGEYRRMLEDFKKEPDFQVDIPRLVGMLDDQMFVFSATEKPITATSERAAVGIPLKSDADAKYIIEKLKNMSNGKKIVLAGKDVIESDSTKVEEEDEIDMPPGFEGFDDGLEEEPDQGGKEERFKLFEKRYMAVQNGILIITNDKQYMRQLLSGAPKAKMSEAADYIRVKQVLDKLTDSQKVRFRRFVRLDRVFEVNYQILRKGEMSSSPTMIGRILNNMYKKSNSQNESEVRKQRLDGSKLPEDYQNKIAPFLGPTGWVTEVEADGWRISGCLLKK